MKKRIRIVSAFLCLAIIISTIFCTGYAFADRANIKAEPKVSWLSDVYIRESSADFVKDVLYPDITSFNKQEASFRAETDAVRKLIDIDINTLDSIYVDIINKAFGVIDSLVSDVQYPIMKEYLILHHKIVYPEPPKETDSTYTTILYAVLTYDLMYPLNGKHFTVPENTTLDRAMVLLVSEILSDTVGEEIDTLEKYAILNIKRSLVKNGYLESVDSPVTDEELLLLYKMMIAENEGYIIENHNVSSYTDEDKAFVHNSYAAAVIKMNFKVKLTPAEIGKALKSEDPDALEKAILTGMIKSKNGEVTGNESVTVLLNKASRLGCFKLDTEFYSDIYVYDVYLIYDCNEIWVTPFVRAAELGKEKLEFLDITINGEKANHSRSTKVKINDSVTKVTIKLKYEEGETKDKSEYVFRIHNGERELPKVDIPTPSRPSYDAGYTGPNLIKPNLGSSRFELRDPNAVIIDPFKVGLDASHSIPISSSILNPTSPESEINKDNNDGKDDTKKQYNKSDIILSLGIATVILLLGVLIFIILKKKGLINLDKKSKKKKPARRPRKK